MKHLLDRRLVRLGNAPRLLWTSRGIKVLRVGRSIVVFRERRGIRVFRLSRVIGVSVLRVKSVIRVRSDGF
jgi:hypothetical protein